MWIKCMIHECDFTGKAYDSYVEGAGAVARGATGRWCVVMHAGPEYIKHNNVLPMDRETAIKKIELNPEAPYDYADF